jgi:toxin-antitoxin system PIN domain toxin
MKPHLVDTNVMLALSDEAHQHHLRTKRWLAALPDEAAVLCRVTQLALLRLTTNPVVMQGLAVSPIQAWQLWHELIADTRFRFAHEPRGLDLLFQELTSARERISGATWTDLYLYAFAQASGLRLATLDEPLLSLGPEVDLIP